MVWDKGIKRTNFNSNFGLYTLICSAKKGIFGLSYQVIRINAEHTNVTNLTKLTTKQFWLKKKKIPVVWEEVSNEVEKH